MISAGIMKYSLQDLFDKDERMKMKIKRSITIAESRDRVNFSSNSFALLLVTVKIRLTGIELASFFICMLIKISD